MTTYHTCMLTCTHASTCTQTRIAGTCICSVHIYIFFFHRHLFMCLFLHPDCKSFVEVKRILSQEVFLDPSSGIYQYTTTHSDIAKVAIEFNRQTVKNQNQVDKKNAPGKRCCFCTAKRMWMVKRKFLQIQLWELFNHLFLWGFTFQSGDQIQNGGHCIGHSGAQ